MNACHEDLTLWLDEDSDELIILDQTKLPGKEETVSISTARRCMTPSARFRCVAHRPSAWRRL